jgi:hypothetical protein
MRRFKLEELGAGLGIVTGMAAIPIALFAGTFLLLFGVTEFGGTHGLKPLIGPGWSSISYAIAVLAGGLLALRWPRSGGAILLFAAVIGWLFGTSRYPIIESLSLIAGLLCLFGGWNRRVPRMNT